MKNILLVTALVLFSQNILSAQGNYIDLVGTGEDQFTFVPPPQNFEAGLRTVTFNNTFTGFSTDAQNSFQYATDIWSSILNSNIPIKVNAYFLPILPGVLGVTFSNGRKNFPNAPYNNVWYASSLANAIADSELNAGEFDCDLFLNSSMNWYFGTDGNCPSGKYDFVSIVLHEICHALGFVSFGKDSAGLGSFGLIYPSDFPGVVTSFPWADLDTLPSVFDLHLQNFSGANLDTFSNPSTDLAAQFTNNSLWFFGDSSQVDTSLRPRLYAPISFSLGSSLLHLNESTYPAGNMNELMTPFSGTANAIHDPGPVTINILKDIGWNVNYTVGIETATSSYQVKVIPNPAHDEFTIYPGKSAQSAIEEIDILDFAGRKIIEMNHPQFPVDISGLSSGIFFCRIKSSDKIFTTKFVKQ